MARSTLPRLVAGKVCMSRKQLGFWMTVFPWIVFLVGIIYLGIKSL